MEKTRGKTPNMSLPIFIKIFFLALLGVAFSLNIFNLGVKYTSSTVTAAMTNALPVVTFAIAVLLRIESVKPKEAPGTAKIVGIVLCLAGVLVLAFYEGPHIKPVSQLRPILHGSNTKHQYHSKREWIMGTFILIIFAISCSLWMIFQGHLLNQYPSKLMFSTTCNFLGTIQSFFVALLAERDFNKWKLHFDNGLLGVSYTGIFVSGISFYLQVWCIERRGAVFVTVWQPLSLLITLDPSKYLDP
ncbi:hypothetical protein LUZ61_007333 [Rhynchospora tenuis]|uniref:WAT1-related protein n=1 Tax=Rhynchospora tenuis TaxID=198213 RepID=A0AAD5ZTG3_9POAL|nr:hypothetical protein LUZ61_007333 [Rhynchospora tenuis]